MREVCLKKLNLQLPYSSLRTADAFPVVASLPRRPEMRLLFAGYPYRNQLIMVEIALLWTVWLTVACLKLGGGRGRGVSIFMVILHGKFASANLISMEFLPLFLRCHFAGKRLVVSRQPHSQGSLLPTLLLRRAGRREPWEWGWHREMLAVFSDTCKLQLQSGFKLTIF